MERIHCPAPLPEEPAGLLLTKMLVPAPYKAPNKEASKKVKKTRSGLRRREASDANSEGSSDAPSSADEEEEAKEDEPRSEGGKKHASSPSLEAKSPERGRGSHPEASTPATDSSPEWDPRAQPLEKSKVTESRMRLCIQGRLGIVILTVATSRTLR